MKSIQDLSRLPTVLISLSCLLVAAIRLNLVWRRLQRCGQFDRHRWQPGSPRLRTESLYGVPVDAVGSADCDSGMNGQLANQRYPLLGSALTGHRYPPPAAGL